MSGTSVEPLVARVWRRLGRLLWLVLLVAACTPGAGSTSSETSNLTLDELPIGIGRGFLLVGLDGVDNRRSGVQPGDLAPNFRLQTDDGRHLSLHDLHGRPVLINFWATWCGPCRLEMPELVDLAATHEQLVVLAVNVQEEIEQIQPFAEDFQMTMPVVRDADGALRQQYAVRGMPTSIFIDQEGKIAAVWSGVLTKKLLRQFISEIE